MKELWEMYGMIVAAAVGVGAVMVGLLIGLVWLVVHYA